MKVKQNIISFLLGMAIMLPFGGYATDLIVKAVNVPILIDGQAIETTVYNINGKNYTSVRDVAENMGGTVEWKNNTVYIETPKTDIEKVVEKCKESCVMIYVYKDGVLKGNGSGFAYGDYIITAKHVTDAGNSFAVFIDGGLQGITASLVPIDSNLDISALKVDYKLPSVALGNSDKLKEGEKVVAITSPKGVQNAIDECFYHGKRFTDGKLHLGISDSNIAEGSSGGAVFDLKGNLVGMVTRGVSGNGAAIPINKLKPILEKLN